MSLAALLLVRADDAAPDPPTASVSGSLPDATKWDTYRETLPVNGAVDEFAITVIGNLPPGIDIDTDGSHMVVFGKPTVSGTFTWDVVVAVSYFVATAQSRLLVVLVTIESSMARG